MSDLPEKTIQLDDALQISTETSEEGLPRQ